MDEDMVNRAYDERWIDFVKNKGKSTGSLLFQPVRFPSIHPDIMDLPDDRSVRPCP